MSYQTDGDTRETEAMRKVFVGGLSRDTTEETFFGYFERFGNMVDKVIIKDPQSKQSRGFGFVTYDHSDCVEDVFQQRPHVIDGKELDVKRAMPREFNTSTAHSKVNKLFIGGVNPDLTPEELQNYIESRHSTNIGTVEKIDFLKDPSGKNKGFGFLMCSSTDFADRLVISENSFMLRGKSMSLKKAEPKPGEGGNAAGGGGGPMRSAPRGRGGSGRGAGGRGGRGGPRGGGSGPRGGGGGRGGFQNYDNYSTGYPSYGGNSNGSYNNYGNQQQQYNQGGNYQQQQGYNNGYNQGGQDQTNYGQSNYGQSNYGAYGGGQQQQRTGGNWGGGNNRYQPY